MAKDKKKGEAPRSIQNRKARFDYAISDEVEAGIALHVLNNYLALGVAVGFAQALDDDRGTLRRWCLHSAAASIAHVCEVVIRGSDAHR